MSAIQVHLAINHIPVIGIPLSAIILLVGLLRRSEDIKGIALWMFLVIGLFTLAVSNSGDAAHELMQNAAGVMPLIHEHEEAAEYATTAGVILAVVCALQLGYRKWKNAWLKGAFWITLAGAVFMSVILARVAHLGGMIEHVPLR